MVIRKNNNGAGRSYLATLPDHRLVNLSPLILPKFCKMLAKYGLVVTLLLPYQPRAMAQQATDVLGARIVELDKQRKKTEAELSDLQSKISLSEERKTALVEEISTNEADVSSINRNLIETSSRSRNLEERIERAASRLEELRRNEDGARKSLLGRRSVLIELVAALQRMGHRPPPALLVSPEDALQSVRSAMLLGAVLPEIREETTILATELRGLIQIREEISSKREKLVSDMQGLAEEEVRLSLLLEQKRKLGGDKRAELSQQTALAAELAGEATSLQELIGNLNNEIDAVKEAAEAARLAEEERLREESQQAVDTERNETRDERFANMARIAPAMPFSQAKGLLPRPVSGVEVTGFNQKNLDGEISKGLSIAARNNVRVLAPSDGWIIYAGPFRSYGKLVIVNAGNGYHVVLAGLDKIDAEIGQFILTGEPIGSMGGPQLASNSNVNVGTRRPVLYVEFRKDGVPIDSSPWWANKKLEERS